MTQQLASFGCVSGCMKSFIVAVVVVVVRCYGSLKNGNINNQISRFWDSSDR